MEAARSLRARPGRRLGGTPTNLQSKLARFGVKTTTWMGVTCAESGCHTAELHATGVPSQKRNGPAPAATRRGRRGRNTRCSIDHTLK